MAPVVMAAEAALAVQAAVEAQNVVNTVVILRVPAV